MASFPDSSFQDDDKLGRLKVTNTMGDTDDDGDFDELYSFGSRSFSIWDEDGVQVFDSGDIFEQTIANLFPEYHNWDAKKGKSDGRRDNKGPGPGPEALAIGKIDDSI